MSGLRYQTARSWESRWKRIADDRKARSGADRLFQVALAGAAPLYGLGSWLHRMAYHSGLRKTERVDLPVICVGNLTLGGAGKTPVVAWLVRRLCDAGMRPAVVSRGYGGRVAHLKSIQAVVVSEGREPLFPPEVAGDEPVELTRLLPGTPIVVGPRRATAARLAGERFQPDVLILDDGFQHYALGRDYNLVVLDATRPPRDLRRFPRGSLREGLRALRRADGVILTRCDQVPAEDVRALLHRLRRRFRHLALAPSLMEPEGLATLEGDIVFRPPVLSGKKALVFCGVGNPESVRRSVEGLGLAVVDLRALPDHTAASPELLEELRKRMRDGEADFLVCTPKDAVKLAQERRDDPDAPLLVVRSRLVIRPPNAEARLVSHLMQRAFRGRA